MSELSGHDCPRCNVELYIETSGEIDGVDLLICKQCWGVGVIAKSMEMVFGSGNNLEQKKCTFITKIMISNKFENVLLSLCNFGNIIYCL